MRDTITIPVAGINETQTFHAHPDWFDRIAALSEPMAFGPNYSRKVRDVMTDMSHYYRTGSTDAAESALLLAEAIASGLR